MREEARPAAEVHEAPARLEGLDDAPPGSAPKPQIEVRALRKRERPRGFAKRGIFTASESQRRSRRPFGVPFHGRP